MDKKKKKKIKKRNNKSKKFIILFIILISFVFIVSSFFYLENKIYKEINSEFPGDCGHFAVWMASINNRENLFI